MATGARSPWEVAASAFELTGAASFYDDPVAFCRECIDWSRGEGVTPYQIEILAAVPLRRRVSVRGPHGLGKTTIMALTVLWFALTRDAAHVDWKCVTTAGAWRQLTHYLWPEIHKWAGRLRWDKLGRGQLSSNRELLMLQLTLRIGQAFAAAASDHQKIEGAHADSILYIFDEAKSISAPVFDAAEGAFSAARPRGLPEAFALACSTPGDPSGRFYEIQSDRAGYQDWWARHVTVDECIAAGRVSPEWVQRRALQWGADSALYANRVLGQFHSSDEDSVIPLRWVELAVQRWQDWDDAGRPAPANRPVHGIDVAHGGADLTVLAQRLGPYVLPLSEYNVADTTKVIDLAYRAMGNQRDVAVVDVIGVGAGVVDSMRRAGFRQVRAYNAARASTRRDRSGEMGFVNQRAAMWWLAREMLDPAFGPELALPPDDALIGELSAPKWRLVGNKIQVESKPDIRARIGRSTDHADAVLQTLLTDREFNQEAANGTRAFEWTDGQPGTDVFAWTPDAEPDEPPAIPQTSNDWGQDMYESIDWSTS